MSDIGYSEKVMDHFRNPRNVGTLDDPDGVGVVGNPVCGDLMEIHIRVRDDRIEDIRFKTFGCGSAIATSSMITEMARGKSLEEAMQISRNDVAQELGGLPPQKMHCSNLAADALKKAIRNFRGEDTEEEGEGEGEEDEEGDAHFHDPACKDTETPGVCVSCQRKNEDDDE